MRDRESEYLKKSAKSQVIKWEMSKYLVPTQAVERKSGTNTTIASELLKRHLMGHQTDLV